MYLLQSQINLVESRDTREDDYSIKVSATVVSIQWIKKDEGSLGAF